MLVDTNRYQLNDEKGLVMTHEGKLRVERVTFDFTERSPWLGRRFGYGSWKKAKPGSLHSATKSGLWIIGAVVEAIRQGGAKLTH